MGGVWNKLPVEAVGRYSYDVYMICGQVPGQKRDTSQTQVAASNSNRNPGRHGSVGTKGLFPHGITLCFY